MKLRVAHQGANTPQRAASTPAARVKARTDLSSQQASTSDLPPEEELLYLRMLVQDQEKEIEFKRQNLAESENQEREHKLQKRAVESTKHAGKALKYLMVFVVHGCKHLPGAGLMGKLNPFVEVGKVSTNTH
jgi:hypothetical protein